MTSSSRDIEGQRIPEVHSGDKILVQIHLHLCVNHQESVVQLQSVSGKYKLPFNSFTGKRKTRDILHRPDVSAGDGFPAEAQLLLPAWRSRVTILHKVRPHPGHHHHHHHQYHNHHRYYNHHHSIIIIIILS